MHYLFIQKSNILKLFQSKKIINFHSQISIKKFILIKIPKRTKIIGKEIYRVSNLSPQLAIVTTKYFIIP